MKHTTENLLETTKPPSTGKHSIGERDETILLEFERFFGLPGFLWKELKTLTFHSKVFWM